MPGKLPRSSAIIDPSPDGPVLAIARWDGNAHMIRDGAARLGYLAADRRTLDPTYGRGTMWKLWRPELLIAHDLDPDLSPTGQSVDGTAMFEYVDGEFDDTLVDGPYKLNGTPTEAVDARFGVHEVKSRAERMALLEALLVEACRVTSGHVLFKCQDQVNGGKVRWQTDVFTDVAKRCGFGKVDRLDLLSYRAQPEGVRQVTARRNSSALLVFRRGWRS